MPPIPWKTISAPDDSREYVALVSFLPLKSFLTVPLFLWMTLQIQRQLAKSRGLIGYSLQAEPSARRFWTLSVWADQQSLMDFVRQAPHGRIMQALASRMEKTRFVQWKLPASAIPPRWEQAKARLE